MKEDKGSLPLLKKLNDFTGLPFQRIEVKNEWCAGLTMIDQNESSWVIGKRMGQFEGTSLDALKKIYASLIVKDSINNAFIAYIPLSKISEDIVQLENKDKLIDRNCYFDLLYNLDYKKCEDAFGKIKELISVFITRISFEGMDEDTDDFCKALIEIFSNVFIEYEQLKLIDFTSATNQEKSDRLLNGLLFEVERFFKFIMDNDLSGTRSPIRTVSFYLFDFFKCYGETAERWSVNFKIDTGLWSSSSYLNLLLQSLNNCIIYERLKLDVKYIEKMILHGPGLKALESKNIDPNDRQDLERNWNTIALITYVESLKFKAALDFYDILFSKFDRASYKDKSSTVFPIVANVGIIFTLFKSCLSLKILETTELIQRISNLQVSLGKLVNMSKTLSSEFDLSSRIFLKSHEPKIHATVQQLKTILNQAKSDMNSKKKNKKKKARKNKSLTQLSEKKPDTSKSEEEDKTNISQPISQPQPQTAPVPAPAPKDNKLDQVSPLVPPLITLRISDELIQKHEPDSKNKADKVEDKSEKTVFYPLTNRSMPGNKKIQAMITKELLEKLPLSLIQAAIQVLKGELIGIKKNEVKPFTGTDRQHYKLPQEVTHGITVTVKFGTYHLFAQWSKEKENLLEFNRSDYTKS